MGDLTTSMDHQVMLHQVATVPSLFPSYDYVLTTDASESGAGATLKKGNKVIKTWSFQWSTTQSNM
ncbi:hypothetical protein DDB_G0294342 [Dictyostelium discoideum AX4]|uniref:Reverse transcriptase/retrotransposon-derived protein RNase H-like domain-containing protein n=1 Tax=Dictyostelium discoideum TaxID=44689 RepID=Q54AM5_DICDI|nr:hypothetical protein DDB_G0294342 [Dictyostelium discoideum AX4]EAL60312.1 hypothetical protein DDB_G0294342 [Dictyostelium discoideum AX4]|eukprot:XP_628725.1 hypothetical protein DDB_G0294342 [Dictyostelium discoideum AX4]